MPSDPSTVRAVLVLLERCGLVERVPHPTDGRARTVALTPAGKRAFRVLWAPGEPIRGGCSARSGRAKRKLSSDS